MTPSTNTLGRNHLVFSINTDDHQHIHYLIKFQNFTNKLFHQG